MAEAVRMPLLSDTMKEGVIAEWHKKVGDTVKSDDIIAEVETDKATMEVMPYVDGTLLYIGVEKGKGVPVNGIMAIIGKPGEDYKSILDAEGGGAKPAAEAAPAQPAAEQKPAAAPAKEEAKPGADAAAPAPAEQPKQEAPAQAAPAAEAAPAQTGDDRVKASPLAKKLAEEKGVDIHEVKGSGDNGRIIKRDIDSHTPAAAGAPAQQGAKAPAAMPVAQPAGVEGHTDTPLTQMRKIIAKKLSDSMFTAPHFYLRMTITMDKAIEARKAINDMSPVKVSFNDLVIKACAIALRRHPAVNSSWMGDFIRQNHHIHIGTAVAVEEGLIVPVIKFADQKSLSQIAQEAGSLYEKARTKKIQPAEFTGNTFTISNLGMMDIDEFTAIINPPDSCILAVGKITPTPVIENGQVVTRQLMKLTLSCDHRVVDGAVGSRFLQTLKAHLENPVTMLV
ncbi:MAG: pyruvate dehydrogenase complex dihydrolipoamide acetyltransferase [Flavipsychrobacter sp.]|nr:pyruvate dehydrogenase complex dihydrolipoamide acetyltransferase [Flavipsychrobacter sp.]